MAIVSNVKSLQYAIETTMTADTQGNVVPAGTGTTVGTMILPGIGTAIGGVIDAISGFIAIKGKTKHLTAADASGPAGNFAAYMSTRYAAAYRYEDLLKIATMAQVKFNAYVPTAWGWNAPGSVAAADIIRSTNVNVPQSNTQERLRVMFYATAMFVLMNADVAAPKEETEGFLMAAYNFCFAGSVRELGLDITKVDSVAPVSTGGGGGGVGGGLGTTASVFGGGAVVMIALAAIAYLLFFAKGQAA